ncbi:oxidoreductase [Azorhizobium oxalatiphilum]|uniref:Oxidoreductase n=1 Tax=Azorhizobium oxalatiphilum TaxID=980631 RepID=A0A917BYS6_9HYPH|nr:sulfite reductase flavoprotein subunit alpha [Azorhizobium oxalatiphilum]GGF62096.1 oxidoreductase [Azorhizobium oxalatiphilum]
MIKAVLFQLHWFFGITAGIVLGVVGLTGGMLSFEDEIISALNPGIITVAPLPSPLLTPDALLAKIRAAEPDRAVTMLVLRAEPDRAARVLIAPPPGTQGRGEVRYANPYDGALLPPPRGQETMRFIMQIHRWLAAGEVGKQIVGASTAILIFFALSGLYLRWPRNALSLKRWFTLDLSKRGRSLFWELHSVIGTWVLPFYLLAALTGLTWSYEWYRMGFYDVLGAPRPTARGTPPAAPPGQQAQQGTRPNGEGGERGGNRGQTGTGGGNRATADLATLWPVFLKESGGYEQVILRLPQGGSGSTQSFQYLPLHAPHDRASNTLVLDAAGKVREHKRYADLPLGQKLAGSIFPLHSGSFFGLPGTILMMVASLLMPLFTVTGWLLYLDRRRKKQAIARQSDVLDAPHSPVAAALSADVAAPVLVAFASQSGTAERLAWQSAGALKAAGLPVEVKALGALGPDALTATRRALFVVSTFGEGEAPDAARAFARRTMAGTAALGQLDYGVLALGERSYDRFCGFGRDLDAWLRTHGATPLFDRVEVDGEDPSALRHWQAQLGAISGATTQPDWVPPAYGRWRLTMRQLLNAGSQGLPSFHLALEPMDAADLAWIPGDIAEIGPHNAPAAVEAFLSATGHTGQTQVATDTGIRSLRDVLAERLLPAPAEVAGRTPDDLARTLPPLPHREYSIASIPEDGRLELLVRQTRTDTGFGLGSGWLTSHAPKGGEIALRVRRNSAFHPPAGDQPLILIGNGTGLAGLRAHLKARIRAGHDRNWLIFGERNAAHDFYFRDEIAGWTASGGLEQLDLAFSRDGGTRYVQDVLAAGADSLKDWVANGAAIYVCGSLAGMAPAVHDVLVRTLGADLLEQMAEDGRYRRDVY